MQRFLPLIVWLMLVAHAAPAQRAAGFLAAEQARFEAMTTHDTLALPRLLHPDLLYAHSNGLVETRHDFVTSVATGRIDYRTVTREGAPTVRRYGRTGVVSGVVHVTGVVKGNPFDIRLQYLAVYRRSHWRWQLLRWQSSRL